MIGTSPTLEYLPHSIPSFVQAPILELKSHQVLVETIYTRMDHEWDVFRCHSSAFAPITPKGWGVAKVCEIGKDVTLFKSGDLVHGPMCHGRQQTVSVDLLYKIPSIRQEFTVFCDAGLVALQAVHLSQISYGNRIAIVGAGTYGLMAMQYALYSGAREIVVIDPLTERLDIAQRLGAHTLLTSFDTKTLIQPLNAIIDFSGDGRNLHQIVSMALPGCVVVAGVLSAYLKDDLFKTRAVCQKRSIMFHHLKQVRTTSETVEAVIYSLANKHVIVWPIISEILPFEQAVEGYQKNQDFPGRYPQILLSYKD